jgi:hypothetical protein
MTGRLELTRFHVKHSVYGNIVYVISIVMTKRFSPFILKDLRKIRKISSLEQ